MNFSAKLRITIFLVVGLPSILGVGLIVANQLNTLSLENDYRIIHPVVIDKSAFDTASQDIFEFLKVDLKGDLLTIEVTYTGSRNNHVFELIGPGEFMESNPIQTKLVLSHDSNGDLGNSLITKELFFDLKPLKEAFFDVYSFFSPDGISLMMNLENYGYVMYS